ncbi:DUF1697 domain-containing protein [Tsukamurella sp. 8F]|uniref:DUF1697 domain-containing protein n=1 Tax=unclassified Tsukamurella TaxID=2633480 RepID=UPI0023B89F9C|nr:MULTISPECIES: DUF1697 domain-containing protein [unclassified Tsukamurella]MDF0532482.1 DUF1697 domain-containing protein [Tsukamurella sp. 8J]MDF0589317.1 DUF1697 domain-containing protein [Tsukamurella sp. 8F]
MTSYVALLRGINVGGGNKILMADLRGLVSGLGHEAVRTVLASGNVVFESPSDDPAAVRAELETALSERYSYTAIVFVLTRELLAELAAAYPFEPREGYHDYLMIVDDSDALAELAAVETDGELERTRAGDGCLYWQVERGQTLQSRVGKASGVRRIGPHTTSRNLNTVRKLL